MSDLIIGIALFIISLIDFYFYKKRPGQRIKKRRIKRKFHIDKELQQSIHFFSGILFMIGSILFIKLALINYFTDYLVLTRTIWSVYMIICIMIIEIYIFTKTLKW